MDEYVAANQRLWDEWTAIHEHSEFYDVEGFKRGDVHVRPYEREEMGPVEGKELLHLQCHFGLDTLSWARLGARVTGVDFSRAAVELATRLAAECGLEARFLQSDLYELPEQLSGQFDVVYTSRGVLGWLPDIERWAEIAAHYVKPGGFLYVTEIHPIAHAWEDEGVSAGELRLCYPYWSSPEPLEFAVQGSYADPSAKVEAPVEYGWPHGLGEIVSAVAAAGLRLEFLHELPFVEWELPFLEERDGTWRLPAELDGKLPLFFSLKASQS